MEQVRRAGWGTAGLQTGTRGAPRRARCETAWNAGFSRHAARRAAERVALISLTRGLSVFRRRPRISTGPRRYRPELGIGGPGYRPDPRRHRLELVVGDISDRWASITASRSTREVGRSSNFRMIPALASVRRTRPSSAPSRPRSRPLNHWRLTAARRASCSWVSPRRRRCSRSKIPRVRADRTNMDEPRRGRRTMTQEKGRRSRTFVICRRTATSEFVGRPGCPVR